MRVGTRTVTRLSMAATVSVRVYGVYTNRRRLPRLRRPGMGTGITGSRLGAAVAVVMAAVVVVVVAAGTRVVLLLMV